ncbi:ATP-dependent nuclease [Kribbella sp. CA-253562]|uniref:ATP-dependent nuclease n=1 Tax=Kribbella sp. CA-253562 TaxID=3239942 RepID=UPI003D8E06FA
MIEKIRIRGYRKFRDIVVVPSDGLNILVGDNESGKSTIIEALNLAMTGRVNGRPAIEELNPYWFNEDLVRRFFQDRADGKSSSLPEISIEIFFHDSDELQRLVGAHNSDMPARACPGVELAVEPNPEYADEIETYLNAEPTAILPVEYFRVEWRTFGDRTLTAKPRELTISQIDSRTIRSTSGIDFHMRQILSDHLEPKEEAAISVAYRSVKERMTKDHLGSVNQKMSELQGALDNQQLSLAMDQSSRSSWDASVSPHVADLPFGMAGLGQQVAVKIALAMGRSADIARVVTIEEPENHLSHTSLNKLVSRINKLKGERQQLFATTHSSYVLNRLGLDSLLLVSDGIITKFGEIDPSTVKYFRRLPGYDTLRLVLAERVVLVEGPSDEIVFERFYRDKYGKRPIDDGIDVVSMRGLSLKRCLEVAKLLDKRCASLRDNDGEDPFELRAELSAYLDGTRRELFVGAVAKGKTLEPQIVDANDESVLREVLGITEKADVRTWMKNNKTDAALHVADSKVTLIPPDYIAQAIEFIHD